MASSQGPLIMLQWRRRVRQSVRGQGRAQRRPADVDIQTTPFLLFVPLDPHEPDRAHERDKEDGGRKAEGRTRRHQRGPIQRAGGRHPRQQLVEQLRAPLNRIEVNASEGMSEQPCSAADKVPKASDIRPYQGEPLRPRTMRDCGFQHTPILRRASGHNLKITRANQTKENACKLSPRRDAKQTAANVPALRPPILLPPLPR